MIPVKNVYYMLSYAFRILNEQGFKSIETEEFNNVGDLCAAILSKGMNMQLKRGLCREYIPKVEELICPKGKIEINTSIKELAMFRGHLVCSYDDFSVDSYFNKIIKSTLLILLKEDISSSRKKEIKKILILLSNIGTIDLNNIDWRIQYNRNNQTYRMLISICYLVVKGLLQTKSDGSTKLMDFLDDQQMHHLYEKFILEYYRKEHPSINANASQIPWQLDDGYKEFLPVMQSDIMLSYKERTLIIDAKYYSHSLQKQFDTQTIHSGNIYQIYTYVKNKDGELKSTKHEPVAGMLLYAQTADEGFIDQEYKMSGNTICVKTLDLGSDFQTIRTQLDEIVQKHLCIKS